MVWNQHQPQKDKSYCAQYTWKTTDHKISLRPFLEDYQFTVYYCLSEHIRGLIFKHQWE